MKWLFSLGKTCWLVRKISYCHNLCHSCYQVTCIIQIYTVVTKNLRKSVEVSYSLFCHMVSDVSFQSWLPSTTVTGPGMKCSVLQGVHGDTKFLLSRQSGRVGEWKREGRKRKGGKRMEVEGREEREGRRGSRWEKNSLKIHRLNPTASCDLSSISRARFFYWYMHDSFSLVFLTQRQSLLSSREIKKREQDTPSKDLPSVNCFFKIDITSKASIAQFSVKSQFCRFCGWTGAEGMGGRW